jgi:hypothetical protein
MVIERGTDMNGVDVWFVLNEANLEATFYSEAEANDYITNI